MAARLQNAGVEQQHIGAMRRATLGGVSVTKGLGIVALPYRSDDALQQPL
jgi:hypothetical protein